MADAEIRVVGRLGASICLTEIRVLGSLACAVEVRGRYGSTSWVRSGEPGGSVFSSSEILERILSVMPPRPNFADGDRAPIRAPWEALAAFANAPDGVAASCVRDMLDWDPVPECLVSIQQSVHAEFTVMITAGGVTSLRWWISGDAGWVALGMEGGEVLLLPSTEDDCALAVCDDLAAALWLA